MDKRMIIAVAAGLMLLASCGTKTDTEKTTDTVCLNESTTNTPSVWPKGEPNDAYAQYFTGQSYLALLDSTSGLCNVTFEPGCRNNWHIHHGATQMLICVSGRGWYQEWGKPAVELRPGVGCSTSPITPTPSPATATSGWNPLMTNNMEN